MSTFKKSIEYQRRVVHRQQWSCIEYHPGTRFEVDMIHILNTEYLAWSCGLGWRVLKQMSTEGESTSQTAAAIYSLWSCYFAWSCGSSLASAFKNEYSCNEGEYFTKGVVVYSLWSCMSEWIWIHTSLGVVNLAWWVSTFKTSTGGEWVLDIQQCPYTRFEAATSLTSRDLLES
jgi:hypothetical protein